MDRRPRGVSRAYPIFSTGRRDVLNRPRAPCSPLSSRIRSVDPVRGGCSADVRIRRRCRARGAARPGAAGHDLTTRCLHAPARGRRRPALPRRDGDTGPSGRGRTQLPDRRHGADQRAGPRCHRRVVAHRAGRATRARSPRCRATRRESRSWRCWADRSTWRRATGCGKPVEARSSNCASSCSARPPPARRLADVEALERLEDEGLVEVVEASGEPLVVLTHPLYGEAVRATMPVLRQRPCAAPSPA